MQQQVLFHDTVDAPPGGLHPRDYQRNAIDRYFELIDGGSPGAIIRLPTGCGKTVTGAWVAEQWINRSDDHYVMVVAHERQLVTQFRNELEDVLGVHVGLEMAEDGRVDFRSASAPRIIVASRQTLYEDANGNSRLYKFDPSKQWLIELDECHRWAYKLKSCRHVLDHFAQNPNSRRLGLTATPERGDGVSLSRVLPDVALDYTLYNLDGGPSAINDGWAVPYDQRFVTVHGVDFKNLREVAGDFDPDQLDDVLSQREQLLSLVRPTLELVGDRRTIIFNPGVNMAKLVAHTINAEPGYSGSAEWLSGSVPDHIRQNVYKRHQRGEFQFMSVCGLCREGYNDPGIGAVAVFRPTKSRGLAEQMKGRGCRPLRGLVDGLASPEERKAAIAASSKPACMIVDMVGVTGMADVATTAHILASGKPDEVIERANQNAMEASGEVDMAEEIRKAEQQLEEEAAIRKREQERANRLKREEEELAARAEAERLSKLQGEVKYSAEQVESSRGGSHTKARPSADRSRMPFGKLKGKRWGELPEEYLKWGMQNLKPGWVRTAMERELRRRNAADMPASERQQKVLSRHGFEANVTYEQAARIIVEEINPTLRRERELVPF